MTVAKDTEGDRHFVLPFRGDGFKRSPQPKTAPAADATATGA